MRSASADVFSFDAVQATASIAGWSFTQEKFFSTPNDPIRGININKTLGIRGRDAVNPFHISGSNTKYRHATTGKFNFNTAIAQQTATNESEAK